MTVYKELTHHGFDVFFDYTGLKSGDFEQAILANIQTRAHFIILLTPSALERCGEPNDWLRREIEEAIDYRRNIIPLMLDNFDFDVPIVEKQLIGKLKVLKKYNGLGVSVEYFDAAMEKLREQFLNVPINIVLHPVSQIAHETAITQQNAASTAARNVKPLLGSQAGTTFVPIVPSFTETPGQAGIMSAVCVSLLFGGSEYVDSKNIWFVLLIAIGWFFCRVY